METFFAEIFERDILKLKDELNAFETELNIWAVPPGISNSAGNLALHLMGNLNHFIGASLGNTGYVRTRDLEFSTKNVSRAQLLADIDQTIIVVKHTLSSLTTAQLEQQFPFELFGQHSTAFYLTHFYGHIAYHLGQINYLRRILEA
jgi:hypothetical protein